MRKYIHFIFRNGHHNIEACKYFFFIIVLMTIFFYISKNKSLWTLTGVRKDKKKLSFMARFYFWHLFKERNYTQKCPCIISYRDYIYIHIFDFYWLHKIFKSQILCFIPYAIFSELLLMLLLGWNMNNYIKMTNNHGCVGDTKTVEMLRIQGQWGPGTGDRQ